jgi:hypothetical protein
MSDPVPSPSARMAAAFTKLRASAKEIKTVSDELSRSVADLERALRALDLRVGCWTLISEHNKYGDEFWREYVGYREDNKQWRIVVQTSHGHDSQPDEADETTWGFDEAPQYLRVKAVDKLPELIEALVTTVDKTAERMKKKVPSAQELAAAVAVIKKVTR